ncbi:MAG: translocation/assembly module TamB domain-containing protein [Pyrinomonadaceae bacterium]
MNGRLDDWAALRYNLNIESTVDLTQTSNIFPLGATLRGTGNFKGNVSGEGENYRVEGSIDSQSLAADGIYLKAVNVAATVEGTNSEYTANGTAVAELLTFDDFRIEFPKLTGNVRGTGTDFRWVGELQAAAAKSKSITLGGLFLSDAIADYKDKEFAASAGNGRVQRFSVKDNELANLKVRNLKFNSKNGDSTLTAPNATADSLTTKDLRLNGVEGRNLRVKDTKDRTDIEVGGLRASGGDVKGNKLKNVTAGKFVFTDRANSTDLSAENLRAERLDGNGFRIDGLEAPSITLRDTATETVIYSDKLRVAKIDAGAAVLGSLNIAGVRLTIRQGRIEGSSKDIDAGTVALAKSSTLPDGGSLEEVRIARPVFVLEPSGRYRASADMSLGGGIIGNIPLGSAQAKVAVDNDRVNLNELTANVMNGLVTGNATIAFNKRASSSIVADFSDLDLAKLAALQGGRVIPLEGKTSGKVNLTLTGTDYRTTSGTVNAVIAANAGSADENKVPISGIVNLSATNGLFNVDLAKLNTAKSELNASGRFDLRNDDSNLDVSLRSTDAAEIENIVRVLGISPQFESQFDSLKAGVAGNLSFDGKITGNLTDPVVDGRASLDSLSLRGKEFGSVTTDIAVSPSGIEIRNGKLQERGGGNIAFNVSVPTFGSNNISVQATLTDINAGNLLAALPIELPERLQDFNGKTTGTVNLSGLPNQSQGEINIASAQGTVAGQAFDSLLVKAVFKGSLIDLATGEIRIGEGLLSAKGSYDMQTTAFDLDLGGKTVPLPLVLSFLPNSSSIPAVSGVANFTATATGEVDRPSGVNINFNGTASNVVINANAFGEITFKGATANQMLNADLVATLEGRPQIINASVNFGDDSLPFQIRTEFDQSPLGPFVALVPQLQGIAIGGVGTGSIEFGGNLAQKDAAGNTVFTTRNLSGSARFSRLDLQLQDTPLVATEPVVVRFNTREIVFESARFSGGGSNVTIAGTKALTEDGVNNLSLDGRINLSLLNVIPALSSNDNFFAGIADVSIRIAGVNTTARVSGTAVLENASFATFIGSDRLTFDRLQGRIRFSANQVQVDEATGYLGGGRFVASGGALIGDNLQLSSFRLDLTGSNITVPLPSDFITTGDAKLEISGRRAASGLSTLIAGSIRARRSLYTKDIDLANVVGSRREGSISSGSSSIQAPRFDLTIEGRDALVIRNNVADLTASASLRLTGNTNNPQISGRITANSGTVFFRKDRYIVQRGVLEFPPNTEIEPIINLQAETEIAGYQVFVNLAGPLTDTEQLSATVRSSPALPQADVISLVTTGNLSNTEAGIPTLAQTGINTAAEILTDSIINNPARKATDKLFGLNVFEIDPIISGQRLNPSARLTVGRQINNNLRVTYATNLSQDQNQVIALEYRVSNKLSFVAQYEQRSLSNVTQDRNNFSLEVRFRRRF